MVEVAKEMLGRLFDQAERQTGTARIPVNVIRYCAVTNAGAKISKSALKQARKELEIESYEVGGTQYWERRRKSNEQTGK
ncbi:hypothetical protein OBO34_21195 [Clostridiales Family XIII bacterium ASD5510]|uniref:Uncharacterized protein n=1 Tax=Hominibacterium faecale TaxID=2839743 RepID=A0A9J6QZ95_9FIRM|nr:hypothetical protein [Hominibacterium faecale]MCU7380833.1 hypothetical protein [Hominibacterium faecale]